MKMIKKLALITLLSGGAFGADETEFPTPADVAKFSRITVIRVAKATVQTLSEQVEENKRSIIELAAKVDEAGNPIDNIPDTTESLFISLKKSQHELCAAIERLSSLVDNLEK